MPKWFDRMVGGAVERLGYQKAVPSSPDVSIVFDGEWPMSSETWIEGRQVGTDDPLVHRTELLALTSTWAYGAIRTVANEFSRADFEVFEKTAEGEEKILNQAFALTLQRPNEHMGRSFLWQYSMWWVQLRGEGYWWLVPDLTGEVAEIWPIPSNRMRPIPDARDYVTHYLYSPGHGKQSYRIPKEMVCFFKLPNPMNYHRGLAPLTAARLALETDQAAVTWNRGIFTDEINLKTLISLSKDISKHDFEIVKADLLQDLITKRLRYLITRGGDVDVKQFGLSQKDLEFLTGRSFTREEIEWIWGLPAGYRDKASTRATAEAAKITLIDATIVPYHTLFAENITSQILVPHYGENLRGAFEDIRPRDRELQVRERTLYWQVKTLDEARDDLGLDPAADPELGATLFPLVVRAASPVTVNMARGERAGNPPATASPSGYSGNGPQNRPAALRRVPSPAERKALDEDLRRWRSISHRRLKAGDDPGEYDFQSHYIQPEVKSVIQELLTGASTDEEVKAAFAAGFLHDASDWTPDYLADAAGADPEGWNYP